MAPRVREYAKILYFVAFVIAGYMLVSVGALPVWLYALAVVLVLGMRVVSRMDVYHDELSLSDEGITRRHGSRMRQTTVEAVRWDELERVEVLSQETGPDRKDLLFLLHGAGSNGVAIPGPLAESHGLVSLLQSRLPGFRGDQLAQALAATQRLSFLLWEREAGTA
jgi:hypothetical protein